MTPPTKPLTNGPAAAAILAAAAGCFTLGLLQLLADLSKPVNKFLTFAPGSGALSGETTLAIAFWLLLWFTLDRAWRLRNLPLGRINATAFTLLALGALLTFPPFDALF